MKIKRFSTPLATALATLLVAGVVSCGGKEESKPGNETPEEIEAARMEARNTARSFINRQWEDTMQLQKELLKAKAVQSKYLIDNKPSCAAAFDSTFIKTIRTVHPELAKHLK